MSATATASKDTVAAARADAHRRRRITGRALALLVVVGALLFAATYPLRAYLDERAKISVLDAKVAALEHQNGQLDHRIGQLKNPGYLEQLARECLGMIKPGEIPFVVVPKHGEAGPRIC